MKAPSTIIVIFGLCLGLASAVAVAEPIPLFRTSAVTKSMLVQTCPAATGECIVKVTVTPNGLKKCDVTIDQPILLIEGRGANPPADFFITWEIDGVAASRIYQFEPVIGIEVAGNDGPLPKREFAIGAPADSASAARFKVQHRRYDPNKQTGYNYTVNVQRRYGFAAAYVDCGSLDPIIVNRD